MELAEIIAELEYDRGKFPRLALESAIQQLEAITPLLLATLEKWKNNQPDLEKDAEASTSPKSLPKKVSSI